MKPTEQDLVNLQAKLDKKYKNKKVTLKQRSKMSINISKKNGMGIGTFGTKAIRLRTRNFKRVGEMKGAIK